MLTFGIPVFSLSNWRYLQLFLLSFLLLLKDVFNGFLRRFVPAFLLLSFFLLFLCLFFLDSYFAFLLFLDFQLNIILILDIIVVLDVESEVVLFDELFVMHGDGL